MYSLQVGSFAKALVAAVAAGSAALVAALNNGSLSTGEWVTVALAVVGALGITYAVPNQPGPLPGSNDEPTVNVSNLG